MDPNNRRSHSSNTDEFSQPQSTSSSGMSIPRTRTSTGTGSVVGGSVSSSQLLLRSSQQQQQHHHHYDANNNNQPSAVSVLSLASNGAMGHNVIGRRSNSNSVEELSFNNQQQQRPMTAQQQLLTLQAQQQQQQQSSSTFRPIVGSNNNNNSNTMNDTSNNAIRSTPQSRANREPTPPGVDEDAPVVPRNMSDRHQQQNNNSSQNNSNNNQLLLSRSGRVSLTQQNPAISGSNNSTASSVTGLPAPLPPQSSALRNVGESRNNNNNNIPLNLPYQQPKFDDVDMFGNGNNSAMKSVKQDYAVPAPSNSKTPSIPNNNNNNNNNKHSEYYQPTVEELTRLHNSNNIESNHHASSSASNPQQYIDDAIFIRECVFAMLACDELQFSRWNNSSLEYSPMKQDCGASPRQRDIYDRFALKLGTMRKRISILLAGPSTSFLQQSLRRAVERQLVSYSRFISSLNEGNSSSSNTNRSQKQRSTNDVQVAFLRAYPKLNALHTALQHSEETKGGELVSNLEAMNHHGGEELSRLLHEVYRETVMPLLYVTLQWLTKGACSDPYSEFFVKISSAVPESSDQYWSEKFSLNESMIPSTFTREQAEMILLVGKNINFLQKCCRVRDWRMSESVVTAAQDATFDSVDSVIRAAVADTNSSLLKVLNEKFLLLQAFQRARLIYLLANGDFTNVIMEKLDQHLSRPANLVSTTGVQDALHNAVASLSSILPSCMDSAAPHIMAEINIPAMPLQQDSGNARNNNNNIQNQNSPFSGWDVFSMSIPFPPPYNAFFTSDTLRAYRRLFRLLWKVKRTEVELKKAWQLYTMADRKFVNSGRVAVQLTTVSVIDDEDGASNFYNDDSDDQSNNNSEDENVGNNNRKKAPTAAKKAKLPGGKKASATVKIATQPRIQSQVESDNQRRLRQLNANAFRHLTHFVNNFQMYLVTEVIEVAWQKLTQDLSQCTSVDEIIAAHNRYLNSMLKYALVKGDTSSSATGANTTNTAVSSLLNKMLNVTLDFCANYQNIVQATYSTSSAQPSTADAANSSRPSPSVAAATEKCRRSIETIEAGMNDLLNILEEDDNRGTQKLEFLNSLASRLNFNFFYGGNDRASSVGSTSSNAGGFSSGRSGRLF